jgi:hypothetical protein
VAYRLSRKQKTIRLGSWIIVTYTILNVFLNSFTSGSLLPISGILIFPLILSLFLLPGWATVGFTLVSVCVTFTLYIMELNGYRAPVMKDAAFEAYQAMAVWLIVIPAPVLVCNYLVRQLKESFSLAMEQNRQLK